MTLTASAAFRVDATLEIGMGHLRRCLTLASQLRDRGWKIHFVCLSRSDVLDRYLAPSFTVSCLEEWSEFNEEMGSLNDELRDARNTLAALGPIDTDLTWVVVDNYRLGSIWEREIRETGRRVMAIDDFRTRMHHADLLVSDVEIPFDPSLNERSPTSQSLVGRQYALIDREYEFSQPVISRQDVGKRLLVCYGGSDPTGETLKALHALQSFEKNDARGKITKIDVVVGPLNAMGKEITQTARFSRNISVHTNVVNLAPLMRPADLILTAGGNTMIEALAMGKPCIVTVTAENQNLSVSQLSQEGVIDFVGTHETVAPQDLTEAVSASLFEFEAFVNRIASRPTFDNLGAQRIAAVMEDMGDAAPQTERLVSC